MGYELDKLMRQFGVSSPTLAYSGAQMPIQPSALASDASASDQSAHAALVAKYDADMPQYNADQSAFNTYKNQYQDQMMHGNMYAQPQFKGPAIPDAGKALPLPTYSGLAAQQALPAPVPTTTYAPYVSAPGTVPGSTSLDKYGMPIGDAQQDYQQYARGGAVRRHFADGGLAELSGRYSDDNAGPPPDDGGGGGADQVPNPFAHVPAPAQMPANLRLPLAPDPAGASPAMGIPNSVMPAAPGLPQLVAKYKDPDTSPYAADLAAARSKSSAASDAFQQMLQRAIGDQPDRAPSKAEMYFRLAAAFGAPTKTGKFTENLANAGATLADQEKEKRQAAATSAMQKLQLGMSGQSMLMAGAKDDLNNLEKLSAEEMKDKRAENRNLSNEKRTQAREDAKAAAAALQPSSPAGKQALDEGLTAGTPAFTTRVKEIANTNLDKIMALSSAAAANAATGQARLALASNEFDQKKQNATKLTPTEMHMKADAETMLQQTEQAMEQLKQAYKLNPNAFTTSAPDIIQRKLLEESGSDHPKVARTRNMENLLKRGALSQLKPTFPGAISDAEGKALDAVQGLNAKSTDERGDIMLNGMSVLQGVRNRTKKRLDDINKGAYRTTTPDVAPADGGGE